MTVNGPVARYAPPWANTHMIGIAGSSGSGKTSLAVKIVTSLNLPWVIILSMDSFYRVLTPEQSERAHRNEYDFDSPEAIDFDVLVKCLEDIKAGRHVEIPIYSFAKHAREEKTTYIYSPHVVILEGIFALHDPRVLKLLDMKIFADTDLDTCLARRIARDVRDRGRDPGGCLKQWFAFVKPNFDLYVEPQKKAADVLIPHGIDNGAAVSMVIKHIQRTLRKKSVEHQAQIRLLDGEAPEDYLKLVFRLSKSPQLDGIFTILQDILTDMGDFIFYFDRLSALLIERALDHVHYDQDSVRTPLGLEYHGLRSRGEVSAVAILRAGSAMESGLRRVIPDCRTGRILIQSNTRTGEPELHYCKLPRNVNEHEGVLLLDPQISSGGTALMAVRVMLDHGVQEDRIVFVTFIAAHMGLQRLTKVYPRLKIVTAQVADVFDKRWVDQRYFGC